MSLHRAAGFIIGDGQIGKIDFGSLRAGYLHFHVAADAEPAIAKGKPRQRSAPTRDRKGRRRAHIYFYTADIAVGADPEILYLEGRIVQQRDIAHADAARQVQAIRFDGAVPEIEGDGEAIEIEALGARSNDKKAAGPQRAAATEHGGGLRRAR